MTTASTANSVVDILAIAAHRDDVEQTCGGTLLKMRTRGSAAERAAEARAAARILKVRWRQALDLPDGRVENTWENRLKIVGVLRELRPRVVILPYWQGRHPDHYNSATLGYEACFISGLARLETGTQPYRPYKVLYASLYADVRPTFIVDITPFIEERYQSLMAYRSQYANAEQGSALFVPEEEIRERTLAEARHYGQLAGVRYGEPFVQKEVGLVEDLMSLPVASM
jgi:bacillithiol biosynthesis deacetylase BshB1